MSDAPHEAFADGIGSWGMIRRFQYLDATGCGHARERGPEFAIVITNEIFRRLPIGGCFSQLLRHPSIGRRASHALMDHPSRFQFYYEEGKERPKEKVRHLQEVTGPDIRRVIAEERAPLLTSWLLGAYRPHVLLNGSLTHVYPQFQQFPANALSSPEPIVRRHLSDQGNRFGRDLRRMRSNL